MNDVAFLASLFMPLPFLRPRLVTRQNTISTMNGPILSVLLLLFVVLWVVVDCCCYGSVAQVVFVCMLCCYACKQKSNNSVNKKSQYTTCLKVRNNVSTKRKQRKGEKSSASCIRVFA